MKKGSNGPKVNGYSNAGRLAALEKRRTEADERNRVRAGRSATKQLSLLDSRPGESQRERARLLEVV